MKLQKLLSLTRKAVDEFRLIDPGDKIAVGISGGKDSLAMLHALCGLKRFYPQSFYPGSHYRGSGASGFSSGKNSKYV